jgi:hypothetical protein
MIFIHQKNRWKILKNFNFRVNKVTKVTKTCCVFHDFCEIWKQPKPKHIISRNRKENLNGFPKRGWGGGVGGEVGDISKNK